MPERLECEVLQKEHYTNPLTFSFTYLYCCRIVSVRETRITGIMSHVFIGLSLLFIDQLQLIPRPVLDGLFLYLAVTALHCNQLFERIMLLVTEQVRHCLPSPRMMMSTNNVNKMVFN